MLLGILFTLHLNELCFSIRWECPPNPNWLYSEGSFGRKSVNRSLNHAKMTDNRPDHPNWFSFYRKNKVFSFFISPSDSSNSLNCSFLWVLVSFSSSCKRNLWGHIQFEIFLVSHPSLVMFFFELLSPFEATVELWW